MLEAGIGEAFAGLAVAFLVYWRIEKRLRLRERHESRNNVLKAAIGEFRSNMAQWEDIFPIINNPKDDGVPFPLFDVAVWPVLAQSPAFATLKEETVAAVIHAYNRMAACNEHCALLADMSHGSTSLLAHTSFAGRMSDPEVELIHDQYLDYRLDLRGKLAGRLIDLCPNLEAAIDALEAEVGIKAPPAALRTFLGVAPHDPQDLSKPRGIIKLTGDVDDDK